MIFSTNSSNFPDFDYEPNRIASGFCSGFLFLIFICLTVHVRRNGSRSVRLDLLPWLSLLMFLIASILRTALTKEKLNSKTIYLITNLLYSFSGRMLVMSNYIFILKTVEQSFKWIRLITAAAGLLVVTSAMLMIPANNFAFQSDSIDKSFLFRKVSSSIFLVVVVLFYPICFLTRAFAKMKTIAKFLILVSSFLCLIVAIFIFIQSFYDTYEKFAESEVWIYCFQILPLVICHSAWLFAHPSRSLAKDSSTDELTPILRQ